MDIAPGIVLAESLGRYDFIVDVPGTKWAVTCSKKDKTLTDIKRRGSRAEVAKSTGILGLESSMKRHITMLYWMHVDIA
jgi:hypothetical protein